MLYTSDEPLWRNHVPNPEWDNLNPAGNAIKPYQGKLPICDVILYDDITGQ